MCILCVVQKWSRRVATMLPWLVIPLIGLWALSQLLPPGFRFEVTSPRLACVLVLLVTIFWYEILMPQLSAWRERRNALNRERKRYEAIEREKLRKTATRLCRNCLSPYKDQNPSGGRFTCSYCGHVSKRPALGLSGFGMDETKISGSGVFENLVTKSAGKTLLNGKVRYNCRGKDGGDDRCSDFFVCNKLASFLLSIRWARIKSFVLGLLADNDSLNREFDEMRKGDNQLNFGESKGEKARRKAEEKRQARLEREQLEEEERKQREEVAKLVEERRKLKDVYMPPEKECGKGSAHDKRKDGKKEAEKKRQERRKEKDIGSSKSNSDVEDLDKKSGKESEKKTENERRDISKSASANTKFNTSDNGTKAVTRNNFSRVAGAKYLERVKGSILSSSNAFNGSGFFGKGAQSSANFTIKANKPNGSVDFVQSSVSWNSPDQMPRKSLSNGGDKTTEAISHIPVVSEIKSQTTPKKSWQQLFTRTQADPISSNANAHAHAHAHAHANAIATTNANANANAISRSEQNTQAVDRSPKFAGPVSPTHPLDNQTYFTLSSPFTHPSFPNASISTTPIFSSVAEPSFPMSGKLSHEEPEIFEDPCYIPDAISLLGPVSESLDNFPLDPLAGFVTDTGPSLHSLQNAPASAEINRPSPIEAPMSRLKVAEERRTNCSQNPFTQSSHDVRTSFVNDSSTKREQGTWQMWNTPSIGQDGLGLVGGTDSWLLPLGQNPSKQESFTYSSPNMGVISEFGTENLLPVTSSPKTVHFSDCQDGGTFSPLGLRNEMMYGSPSRSATTHPYELSAANGWFKDDSTVHASVESTGNSTLGRPYNGGLFNAPDVQSFWSSN